MPELFGIVNLKKAVKFGCDFGEQAASSLADGWQFTDFFSFLDEMAEVPGFVKTFPHIKEELTDLSDAERSELHEYVKTEFDIPSDNVEQIIEEALGFVLYAYSLYLRFTKRNETPQE